MNSSVSMNAPKLITNTTRRSHRIDVHRHADAYLENLEKIAEAEKLNKASYKPGIVVNYISSLAKGLEAMFKALHIKP